MKIDLNLYPKHNWKVQCFDGFFDLICEKCHYFLRERYEYKTYIKFGFFQHENDAKYIEGEVTNEMRKLPLSCEEVMIKKLLE